MISSSTVKALADAGTSLSILLIVFNLRLKRSCYGFSRKTLILLSLSIILSSVEYFLSSTPPPLIPLLHSLHLTTSPSSSSSSSSSSSFSLEDIWRLNKDAPKSFELWVRIGRVAAAVSILFAAVFSTFYDLQRNGKNKNDTNNNEENNNNDNNNNSNPSLRESYSRLQEEREAEKWREMTADRGNLAVLIVGCLFLSIYLHQVAGDFSFDLIRKKYAKYLPPLLSTFGSCLELVALLPQFLSDFRLRGKNAREKSWDKNLALALFGASRIAFLIYDSSFPTALLLSKRHLPSFAALFVSLFSVYFVTAWIQQNFIFAVSISTLVGFAAMGANFAKYVTLARFFLPALSVIAGGFFSLQTFLVLFVIVAAKNGIPIEFPKQLQFWK